jgi:hypothetical protein
MKIFKFITFLAILGGIFLIIYRNSDHKGLRKLWTSFKIAVLVSAIAAGLIFLSAEAIEPDVSNNSPSIERVLSNQEFNSLPNNDRQVILSKAEGKGPNTPGGVHGFPTSPAPRRPVRSGYTPKIGPRVPPKFVNQGQGLGAGANPAGAGGGGGNPQFDESDTCPAPNKEQSQESSTHHHDFTQKKKKRNQHLNRQIEVNGQIFEFERDIIEKKTPSHGTDFGLEPDYGPDGKIIRDRKTGKPRAKQNKENYQKFTDNLSEFVKDPKSERIEPQYRKGRDSEQDAVGFLNRKDRRFVIFNRHTKKYITGWVMNDLQYQEFIDNNNII